MNHGRIIITRRIPPLRRGLGTTSRALNSPASSIANATSKEPTISISMDKGTIASNSRVRFSSTLLKKNEFNKYEHFLRGGRIKDCLLYTSRCV